MDREKRYQAALDTHKHYDNVSLAIGTGMIVVTGACFSIYSQISTQRLGALVFFAGAVIVRILFILYTKSAKSALIARNFSSALEESDLPYGVSYVLVNISDPNHEELRKRYLPQESKGLGVGTRTVKNVALSLVIFLLVAGIAGLFSPNKPINRTGNTSAQNEKAKSN